MSHLFFFQVRYLDCLDFGRKNVPHSLPRVLVWRGDMIHVFLELDRKCQQPFGKKHLKEVWTTGHPIVCLTFIFVYMHDFFYLCFSGPRFFE